MEHPNLSSEITKWNAFGECVVNNNSMIQAWCVFPFVYKTDFPHFSSVQFSRSVVSDSVTPWITACQASVHHQLPESTQPMSIESVMPSSHLILCHPLLLLPPILPSLRVFSNESTLPMRWPKYWSFSFSIIASKEIPGLISFRMDWLDLLAVQRTLRTKAFIFKFFLFFNSSPFLIL